jgi:hypothetical protein
MANTVKPKDFAIERWMKVPLAEGKDLLIFSGYAHFDRAEPLEGTGGNDSSKQEVYVEYEVTDMLVGPHWATVEEVCPTVVAGGHDQYAPDEADAMGYEVRNIKRINVVSLGNYSRIELQVNVKVRGGTDGQIPSLAYHVTALGYLDPDGSGNEGVFFENQP